MPTFIVDQPTRVQIAQDAGLDPNLIPQGDFSIQGDTITYRYFLFNDDGTLRSDGNKIARTEWMTAKVGGSK